MTTHLTTIGVDIAKGSPHLYRADLGRDDTQ